MAVSPDGKSVYIANYGANSISVFARTSQPDSLNQASLLPAQRCSTATAQQDARSRSILLNPRDIEVTPDNKQVLVVNNGCSGGGTGSGLSLLAFDRTAATSAIAVTRHAGGCVSWYGAGRVRCMIRTDFYAPTQFAHDRGRPARSTSISTASASAVIDVATATRPRGA